MRSNSCPIVDAMKRYSSDDVTPFHTPGHKHGRGAHELLRELLTPEGLRVEVSLMDELDDLHAPHGCIRDAQKLAARLWHADETIFFVNGTTSAIQAMIFGSVNAGDLIFVPRNAHRSVISGLILSDAVPIFLPVEFDAEFNLPLNVTVETVTRAIKMFPQAKALLLVSPNYYGVAADVPKIAEIVHAAGMLLLVDEAHGAHLTFSDKLPPSAMDAGADVSAQSTHKILGSLTQTSMLQMKRSAPVERIKLAASLLQTTSPNQILLASLDIARLQLEQNPQLVTKAVDLSLKIRGQLERHGLKVFAPKDFAFDPTKITVNVSTRGLTGAQSEQLLRRQKIQCELSDAANVLFLVTFADDESTAAKLVDALVKGVGCQVSGVRGNAVNTLNPDTRIPIPSITRAKLSPRETFYATTTTVNLRDAVGKICAEEVTFYPPGIPLVMPGEEISAQRVELLEGEKLSGGHVIGAADPTLSTIKIVRLKAS